MAERSRERVLVRWLFLVGASLFVLNMIAVAKPTPWQRVLASLIVLVAGIPYGRWYSRRDTEAPFFAMIGILFAIHFALPIFILERYSENVGLPLFSESLVDKTLIVTLVAISGLVVAYNAFPRRLMRTFVPRLRLDWPDVRYAKAIALIFGVGGVGLYWVRERLHVPLELKFIVDMIPQMALFAFLALFILQLKGALAPAEKFFLWTLILARALIGVAGGVAGGSVGEILRILLLLLLAYAWIRRRIPWEIMLVAAVVFFVLRPVKGAIRLEGTGQLERGVEYVIRGIEFWSEQPGSLVLNTRHTWSRLAYFIKLGKVVEVTPDEVDYLRGKTLYAALYKPVPRFIYPDKPTEGIGTWFGHTYGLLHKYDLTTFVTFPFVAEFYANFGVFGVLIGMMAMAWVYRVIELLFIHPNAGLGAMVGCVYYFGRQLDLGTNFSGLFGEMVYGLIFVVLLCLVMRRGRSEEVSWTGETRMRGGRRE